MGKNHVRLTTEMINVIEFFCRGRSPVKAVEAWRPVGKTEQRDGLGNFRIVTERRLCEGDKRRGRQAAI